MTTILVSDLANELNIDRSNLRKYAIAKGIPFLRVRNPAVGNQLMIALSPDNAQEIRDLRDSEGYGKEPKKLTPLTGTDWGYFYIIQLVPDLDPNRIKLGFSSNIQARLRSHRASAPTAKLLGQWECRRNWEQTAIASATRIECELIVNEVYTCEDVEGMNIRADEFFNMMPDNTQAVK